LQQSANRRAAEKRRYHARYKMDLHGQIMNIQTPDDILSDVEKIIDNMGMLGLLQVIRKASPAESHHLDRMLELAFKEGHKQARHAAAESSFEKRDCPLYVDYRESCQALKEREIEIQQNPRSA
jgi:hypothetical protein